MPLAGKGMLLTSMDIDAADDEDFNRWYDREHLEERVAIEGFIEARRYVAHSGSPKYLCLYSTETIEVLDSPSYRAKLANSTDWSKKSMARFKNMIRAVARITISRGQGRGAVLGIVRLRPDVGSGEALGPSHDGVAVLRCASQGCLGCAMTGLAGVALGGVPRWRATKARPGSLLKMSARWLNRISVPPACSHVSSAAMSDSARVSGWTFARVRLPS